MDEAALFDQIITKLRTKSEVTQAFVCLEEYTTNFFTPKNQVDLSPLFDKLPGEVPALFRKLFLSEQVTAESNIQFKKRADALVEKLHTVNIVQITLAYNPDESAIALFSDWMKKNVTPQTVIDIQYDQNIVGGAQIINGGLYKDYSVRKNLAERFQIQREEIMGMLK